METKKNRVKAVKPYGTQDQYGNFSYIVEFENGDNGFLKTKTDQVGTIGFVVGQEVEYTIDKRVSQAGKEYTVIARPKPEFKGGGGGKYEPKDQGVITWLSCYSSACNNTQTSQFTGNNTKNIEMANEAFKEAMKHSTLPKAGAV